MPATRKSNVALWIVQSLLAALFLFAGGSKLVMPVEAMQGAIPLPSEFLRFIGVAEVLGALGLLLPGILRIRQALTPIAAVGLACIMSGATVISIEAGAGAGAAVPFVVGSLATLIVIGRSAWAPARLQFKSR